MPGHVPAVDRGRPRLPRQGKLSFEEGGGASGHDIWPTAARSARCDDTDEYYLRLPSRTGTFAPAYALTAFSPSTTTSSVQGSSSISVTWATTQIIRPRSRRLG